MKVELLDFMGDDNAVVDAARVSFSKRASQFTQEQNERLIKYLARHKHEMPFAHTAIKVRVKAPISIRTQCFKHKVGFAENEVSRRYVTDKPEIFLPTFRNAPTGNIKQGSGEQHSEIELLKEVYMGLVDDCIGAYEEMIKQGVAPEQARFVLPQGVMTEWIWTGSLLAFARFYNLRSDSHAQKEIQELAKMIGDIIAPLFPVSWRALTDKAPKTKIKWEVVNDTTQSTNTVNYKYAILWNAFEKEYQCYYADGKFKPFKTVAEAQEWVETVHYPEKVKEILKQIGV